MSHFNKKVLTGLLLSAFVNPGAFSCIVTGCILSFPQIFMLSMDFFFIYLLFYFISYLLRSGLEVGYYYANLGHEK